MKEAMKLLVVLLLPAMSRAGPETQQPAEHTTEYHYDCAYCQPEQIHIAFGEKNNDIIVTWSTFNDTQDSIVEYGTGSMELDQTAVGQAELFVDGGLEHRSQWIHTATLKDLNYNTSYVYHAGSEYGWSEKFEFKTPPQGEKWIVRAAIYGDMGSKNAHSLSYLQEEAERGHFDVIFHIGDFAYDMDSDGARVGDQFMRQIQPLAAGVPYMTCPGNHEQAYNFSNYAARFTMPGPDASLFYSLDLGPVHFISISSEVYYYYKDYGVQQIENQYNWLKAELEMANLPENRLKHPWIIIFGHRPMYCSNKHDPDCLDEHTRIGVNGTFALEPLLNQYGVDVGIWAHEHSYERTWPLYDNKVYNGSTAQPYVNPKAPVHIVTGSAGCREVPRPFIENHPEWSAFRSTDYGYTRFLAYNNTHVHFEQVTSGLGGKNSSQITGYLIPVTKTEQGVYPVVSVDQNGTVVDSFYVVKNSHAAYGL